MRTNVGQYIRTVYDFNTTEKGEITLKVGDIVQITAVVDDNWLRGKVQDKEGIFPTQFVEPVTLPKVDNGQTIFAATENFPAQVDGDLEFRKGAIIIGLHQVDSNWWHGQIGGKSGIFPRTHVIELNVPRPSLKSTVNSVTTAAVSDKKPSVNSVTTATVNDKKALAIKARALVDCSAQLDEELGFKTGEIVIITEVQDADWFLGSCGVKKGIFLSDCVEVLTDEGRRLIAEQLSSSPNIEVAPRERFPSTLSEYDDRPRSHSYTIENTRSHDSGVTAYAKALYPFVAQTEEELSFGENDIVNLIRHVDDEWIEGEIDGRIGLFPTNYVEIIVDCSYSFKESTDSTHLQAGSVDEKSAEVSETIETSSMIGITGDDVERYGLVLYNYKRSTSRDLELQEGDTVVIYRQLDEYWYEASDDKGNKGFCPVECVEVIGDEPKSVTDTEPGLKNSRSNGHGNHCNTRITSVANEKSISKPVDNEISRSNQPKINNVGDRSSHSERVSVENDKKYINKETINNAELNNSSPVVTNHIPPSIGMTEDMYSITQPVQSKPEIAPKPFIKPKPIIAPKPHVKPPVAARHSIMVPRQTTIDTSKSLDSLIQEELFKVKEESLSRSRSPSTRSSGSSDSTGSGGQNNANSMTNTWRSGSSESMTNTWRSGSSELACSSAHNNINAIRSTQTSGSSDSTLSDGHNNVNAEKSSPKISQDARQTSFDMPTEHLMPTVKNKRYSYHGTTSQSSSLAETTSMSNKNSGAVVNASKHHSSFASHAEESLTETGDSALSIGKSKFFINEAFIPESEPELVDLQPERRPPMRQPPAIPQKLIAQHARDEAAWLDRKLSLRKPPPPRPTGPRLALAPPKVPMIPTKMEVKPMPRRPAPRAPSSLDTVFSPTRPLPPQNAPPRRPPPRSPATKVDLISFSPNSSVSVDEHTNAEIIGDLHRRIHEVETDLAKCNKSKLELQLMLTKVSDHEQAEINENLEFFLANIQGLSDELERLRESLDEFVPMMPESKMVTQQQEVEAKRRAEEEARLRKEEEIRKREEMKQKRLEKRSKVIAEILDTEKSYLHDLQLCIDVFMNSVSEGVPDVDLPVLFGNMEEITEVSQGLLTSLENAVNGKDFSQQVIGSSFVTLAEDMRNVYAPYCRNHDEVITLLVKYEEQPSAREYIERMLERLKAQMVVFDLGALLIKPVQRILKYPLLLNELHKNTEDDHMDKAEVLRGVNAMTDVAAAINEYKRRKDLVFKYKKETSSSLADKLAMLNLHSIKKKSNRIRGRLTGLQFRDEKFEKAEQRFHAMEKIIKVFLRDVQIYMEQLEDSVLARDNLSLDICDYYDEKQSIEEVQKYRDIQEQISSTFLANFKSAVEKLVTSPLGRLIQFFDGPNNVIQKRYDKLLDYDILSKKSKDTDRAKATKDALQSAKSNYEAMNAQLLDELPTLYNLSYALLKDCSGALVKAQKRLSDNIVNGMYQLMDLPLLLSSGENVMETFNIRHTTTVDRLSYLSFIPRGFNPKIESSLTRPEKKGQKRQSLDPSMLRAPAQQSVNLQSDGQRVYLRQKYPGDQLHRVTQNYTAAEMMDITLYEGDLVALVKDADPMGNRERWYVNNGETQGFVPRKFLVSSGSSPEVQRSAEPKKEESLWLPSPDKNVYPSLDEIMDEELSLGEPEEAYYALYSFQSRGPNEVSLVEGQVVSVLAKEDLNGNAEWWLVTVDGAKGYTPAIYLEKSGKNPGYS